MNLSIAERRRRINEIRNPRPPPPVEKVVDPSPKISRKQRMKMKMLELEELNEIVNFIVKEKTNTSDTRKLMRKMCETIEDEMNELEI